MCLIRFRAIWFRIQNAPIMITVQWSHFKGGLVAREKTVRVLNVVFASTEFQTI